MVKKEAFGGDSYLEEEFKRIIKKFKIKNIVETGTFRGDTTNEFSKMAEKVYTIELDKDFYLNSKRKLKDSKNIEFFLGSSQEIFKKILPNIKGKTLFFLDAHWNNYWPILDELKEISKMPHLSDSVIVIHDFYVPGKNFGFDSYHDAKSSFELFLKKTFSLIGKFLKLNIVPKQRLDYSFIEGELININKNYKHYYNSKAEGAKRGVIFIHP